MESAVEFGSPDATHAAGAKLGTLLAPGQCLALVGDLGAGKTLLVQGIAHGLSVPAKVRVTSPTFTLINEYRGGRLPLFHVDLYRIEREAELQELGLDDIVGGDGVVAIEWADKFAVLPTDHLGIRLQVTGDEMRRMVLQSHGPRSRELAENWMRGL